MAIQVIDIISLQLFTVKQFNNTIHLCFKILILTDENFWTDSVQLTCPKTVQCLCFMSEQFHHCTAISVNFICQSICPGLLILVYKCFIYIVDRWTPKLKKKKLKAESHIRNPTLIITTRFVRHPSMQLHKGLCFNINILSILPVWPTVCRYSVVLSMLSCARVSCYSFRYYSSLLIYTFWLIRDVLI